MATKSPKRDSMEASVDSVSNTLKETSLNNGSMNTKPKPSLATLPPSIRNKIYTHLLDTETVNATESAVSYTASVQPNGKLSFHASRAPFPVCTALFYVNRLISREALQFFYSKNLFLRLAIGGKDTDEVQRMLLDSGILFSAPTSPKGESSYADILSRVNQHAVDILLQESGSSDPKTTIVFPAPYLPRLINYITSLTTSSPSWPSKRSLQITLHNLYTFGLARTIGDLIEPFRQLSGFSSAKLTSNSNPTLPSAYTHPFERSITSSSFNPGMWLNDIASLRDAGDKDLESKKYAAALQLYQTAIIALTQAYLTHAETLHSQPADFTKSVQKLRWSLELKTGISIVRMREQDTKSGAFLTDKNISDGDKISIAKDILLAETATSAALSLSHNSPRPTSNPWVRTLPVELIPPNDDKWFAEAERAESWASAGEVHAAVGEFLFAAGDFERACAGWGLDGWGESRVEGLFRGVRERIDWERRPGMALERVGWWGGRE